MKTIFNRDEAIKRYAERGWQAGIRFHPDCRHQYLEPYRSAYGEAYDAGQEYCRREGITFWDAKVAIVARSI